MKHPSVIENSEARQLRDANYLHAMLFAITRGNPKHTTRAISNMLSNDASKIVKDTPGTARE